MNERLSIGGGGGGPSISELIELAKNIELEYGPAIQDGMVRDKIADWRIRDMGLKFFTYRLMTQLSKGAEIGAEASLGKLVRTRMAQEVAGVAMDLQGLSGGLTGEDCSEAFAKFQSAYWWSTGLRIAGGTDDIMVNILAERVLGMPPEPRVDKNTPFNELASPKS